MNRRLLLLLLYVIAITTSFILYRRLLFNKTTSKQKPIDSTNPPEDIENIPRIYFRQQNPLKRYNQTCANFPKIFQLRFSVDPWQSQETSTSTLHLFNAYFDNRDGNKLIRILAMMDSLDFTGTLYCQLWYENSNAPLIVKAEKILMLWYKDWGVKIKNLNYPYIITCPFFGEVPDSVSLVEKPCDHPSNNLRIKYFKDAKMKNFVVCVKGLNFPFEDVSLRLIEWIELLSILGAEKINFYKFHVHSRVERVLRYYQKKKFVEVVPLTLIGGASNHPHLQNQYLHNKNLERRLQEVIPYNDCLYKHLQEFKFIVVLDIDEVIVPKSGTWRDMMKMLQKKYQNRSSYMVKNVYFLDTYLHNHTWFEDVPKFMHMLQHVYRNKKYSEDGWFVKGFHDVNRILGLHNHYPYACVDKCNHIDIDPEIAHLQHYRFDCTKSDSQCSSSESVLDTRIWNFKQELIERVGRSLQEIKLFNDF